MPRIKIEGKEYDVPTFNLGELRLLKKDFGVKDVEDASFGDPDFLAGLCYVVMRRVDPTVTFAQVDAITEIEVVDDPEDAADPTEAESGPSEGGDVTVSNPATTPQPSGDLSTPEPTPEASPTPTT